MELTYLGLNLVDRAGLVETDEIGAAITVDITYGAWEKFKKIHGPVVICSPVSIICAKVVGPAILDLAEMLLRGN